MTLNQIVLNPTFIARGLGVVAFVLALASVGGQLMLYQVDRVDNHKLIKFFYFDEENNLPTAFSTFLLLFAATLLVSITLLKRKQTGSFLSCWSLLAIGFLYMTFDEELSFHEKLNEPIHSLLNYDHYGIFYFSWVIPGSMVVAVLSICFFRFLLHLPARTRFSFLTAGALYVGGAIGVELIGGYFSEANGNKNLVYSMIVTVEESLEMAGVIVFIWALLNYIGDSFQEVRFGFVGTNKIEDKI